MVAENFRIYSVKITANTPVSQKIESVHFYLCPEQNSPPVFYHYPPGRQELPDPPKQHFLKIFFPEQKGGGENYGVEKITNINKGIGHKF